jgi:hypothetical protein
VDPEVVDYWFAYYQLEPWGDEWRQVGTIAAEMNLQTAATLTTASGQMVPVRSIDSYLPVPTKGDGFISDKRVLSDEEAHFSLMVGFGFT